MRTIDRHLFFRFALHTVLFELLISQVVILVKTVIILRPLISGALPVSVFWDIYFGALPNVIYLTLPIAAGLALIFGSYRLSRDLGITILSGAGISTWRIAAPGLAVAALIAVTGAAIAHGWAPVGAQRLERAKTFARGEFPYRLLPAGQYVDLAANQKTLYFKEWLGKDVIVSPFLFDRISPSSSRIIQSKYARFTKKGQQLSLVFHNGRIDMLDRAEGKSLTVKFKRFSTLAPLPAGLRKSRQRIPEAYERSTAWLVSSAPQRLDPPRARHARAELHKRLAVPFLILCYAPLLIGAAFFIGRQGRRFSLYPAAALAALTLGHLVLIILLDTGVRNIPGIAPLPYVLMLLFCGAGLALIHAKNTGKSLQVPNFGRLGRRKHQNVGDDPDGQPSGTANRTASA